MPAAVQRLHWPISDPVKADTSEPDEDELRRFRDARDQIITRLKESAIEVEK
jgi:hypothetical protein